MLKSNTQTTVTRGENKPTDDDGGGYYLFVSNTLPSYDYLGVGGDLSTESRRNSLKHILSRQRLQPTEEQWGGVKSD